MARGMNITTLLASGELYGPMLCGADKYLYDMVSGCHPVHLSLRMG